MNRCVALFFMFMLLGLALSTHPTCVHAQELSLLDVKGQEPAQGTVATLPVTPRGHRAPVVKTPADLHKGLPKSIRLTGKADRSMKLSAICWYASTNRSYPGWRSEDFMSEGGFGWKPFEKRIELGVPVSADGRYAFDLALERSGSLGTRYILTRAKLLIGLPGCSPREVYLTTDWRSREWLDDVQAISVSRREQGGSIVGPHVELSAVMRDGSSSRWLDYAIPRDVTLTEYPIDLARAD